MYSITFVVLDTRIQELEVIISSYEAQQPKKRVSNIQSKVPVGTGIASEKSAEHPCLLGKNSSLRQNIYCQLPLPLPSSLSLSATLFALLSMQIYFYFLI